MTSSSNSKETTQFFLDNSNFGLDSKQLSFFRQDDWPILDEEGNFFYQQPGEIAYGPNGNGAALFHLVQSGIAARWKEEGVQYVQFVQIDNPLADPFDAELFGFHARKANEISIKCCKRKDPKESVGVLVELDGKVRVVEYTEMDQKERTEMSSHDVLKHQFANISLFCFSMESLFSIAANIEKMPLHAAHKSMKQINTLGKLERPLQPNGWKFELYIFDTLELVTRSSLLVYPREECFAPLKNAFGVDSPETVREALQANDRRIMKSLTGSASPETLFELAQEFYYPTNLLKETWKGHKLSHGGYIES